MVTASDSKADTPRISGVVLILDDFDRFARQTQNIRQQLLYSLFNMIASDDTAPFVIIGVTRRFDAVDLLEKRVRSRFSQVVFRVPPPMSATELQEHLVNRLEAALGDEAQSDTTCLNESLRLLRRILSDDAEVAQRISELFRQCRQMRPYLSALTHMLAVLSYEEDRDPARAVPKLLQIFSLYVLRRDIRQRLCSLSSMELTLLVAHSRIARRQESQSASFAQVYDEYARFIQASAGAAQRNESGNEFVTTGSGLNALDNALLGDRGPLLSKAVALRILERLIEAELLTVAASARNSSSAKMHIPLVQLFPNETLVDVVRKHPCASTSLQRWCKSWLE
jgi:origin recognition complex subunit 4